MTSINLKLTSRTLLLALAAFVLLSLGCHSDSSASRSRPPQPVKEWTFLAYVNGDNNLVYSAESDFHRMAAADLAGNVNLLVFIDYDASAPRLDENNEPTGELYPRGAFLYQVPGGGAPPRLVRVVRELNVDEPTVLRDIVAEVFTRFPSRRRALLLWDHGGSWPWGFGGDGQDGTLADERGMRAAEVADAVRTGLGQVGLSEPLDLLGFDTCLLAGAEVAHEFLDVARLYLANAEIDYGGGWNYTPFLTYLGANPEASLRELGEVEVALWDEWKKGEGGTPADFFLRSHIALDMEGLSDFMMVFADFADGVRQLPVADGFAFARAAHFALPAYSQSLAEPGERNTQLRDLGQFLDSVAEGVAALADSALVARLALANATIAVSQGSLRSAQGGFHLQLPLAGQIHTQMLAFYTERAAGFADATGWDQALAHYAAFDDRSPPAITASLGGSGSPPTLTFLIADEDAAAAEVDLGYIDPDNPDQLVHAGLIARGAIEPSTEYQVAWDAQVTTLPGSGGGQQLVDVLVWEPTPEDFTSARPVAPILAIPGVTTDADGNEDGAWLLYQEGAATAELIVMALSPGGAPAAIALSEVANESRTFTPVLEVGSLSAPGTEQASLRGNPIPLDGSSISISAGPVEPGTYQFIISVSDVFGNKATNVQQFELTSPVLLTAAGSVL